MAAEVVRRLPDAPGSGAALRAGHNTLGGHGHYSASGRDGLFTFLGGGVGPSLVGLLGAQGKLVSDVSFNDLMLEEVAYDGGRRPGHGRLGRKSW